MGGKAARFTFIVNLTTGTTWLLVKNEDEEESFELVQQE
jgi:hypothetical protein